MEKPAAWFRPPSGPRRQPQTHDNPPPISARPALPCIDFHQVLDGPQKFINPFALLMNTLTKLALTALALIYLPCSARSAPSQCDEISLNGIWDFHPEGGSTRHDIRVPSFWDAPQDYGYPAEWLHMQHGVYRKAFKLPETMKGKQVFLRLESVSVIAQVFINGNQVGAEDSKGYLMLQLPYEIDITAHLKETGENQIEVWAWGGKSMIHGSDSQDKLIEAEDFPPDTKIDGRFLFPFCVDHWDGRRGITGDVKLIARPKIHVADVFVIPNLHKNGNPADDEISIRLTVANHDSKSRKVLVRNRAKQVKGESVKDFEPLTITLPPSSTMELVIHNAGWPDAAYWWPHDPQLYLLETQLVEAGTTVDLKTTRFGFREFYVKGDHYQLNGIRANLRGDAYEFSWHEGYRHGPSTAPVFSTKELIPKMQLELFKEYAALNHNMLRPHKASAFNGLYDLCDEAGMMVLEEAPFWETWVRTDERSKPYYEAWVKRWVKERRNHPSIVAWIGANECWYGATGVIAVQAIRSMDTSRPSFHEDPWGPVHHDDLNEPYEGDEDCRHYTGGYPYKKLNTEDLYGVYRANPRKPTGEGESLFPEGFPLMDSEGRMTDKAAARGEFGHPDMISQGQWVRAVCRMFRAMRYAGLSDARLYANWMYAFDPIAADIPLEWEDLSTPGIKPTVLHRPIINVFDQSLPRVRHAPGHEYYRNSLAPVAVFDKEGDLRDRIGVAPLVFGAKEALNRTLVIYNDEFTGGRDITVRWTASAHDPAMMKSEELSSGEFTIPVPYGEKREQRITFALPESVPQGRWLHLTLTAAKASTQIFSETNRLGALGVAPAPVITFDPPAIDLGKARDDTAKQWHTVRLVNRGGGAAVPWKIESPEGIRFKLTEGNLRGEQDLQFQIDPAKTPANSGEWIITASTQANATQVRIRLNP
jgi:hypothetical protein